MTDKNNEQPVISIDYQLSPFVMSIAPSQTMDPSSQLALFNLMNSNQQDALPTSPTVKNRSSRQTSHQSLPKTDKDTFIQTVLQSNITNLHLNPSSNGSNDILTMLNNNNLANASNGTGKTPIDRSLSYLSLFNSTTSLPARLSSLSLLNSSQQNYQQQLQQQQQQQQQQQHITNQP